MLGLVKFSCGCVGWRSKSKPEALILNACDSDDGHLSLTRRPMDKSWEHVTAEEMEHYEAEIRGLLADGYRFRTIRQLLEWG